MEQLHISVSDLYKSPPKRVKDLDDSQVQMMLDDFKQTVEELYEY